MALMVLLMRCLTVSDRWSVGWVVVAQVLHGSYIAVARRVPADDDGL